MSRTKSNEEVDLFDYWRILVKSRKLIIKVCVTASLVSVIISLLLPKTYQAECTVMPVGVSSGGGISQAILGLTGGEAMGGLLGGLNGNNDRSQQLLAIMKSKALAAQVIENLDLMRVLYNPIVVSKLKRVPTMADAVSKLKRMMTITEDKKSKVIFIKVTTSDPKEAAHIANGYLDELVNYINNNTFTSAKKNRIFLEEQLEKNKVELLQAGRELTSFYATNNISSVNPSLDVDVSHDKKEEELFDAQISQLREELETNRPKMEPANIVKDVPQQVYLQYLIIQREILGRINVLLSQQYEMAKITESREDLSFQIIDRAMVPTKRLKPERKKIVSTTFALSLLLVIAYVFSREYLKKIRPQEGATSNS